MKRPVVFFHLLAISWGITPAGDVFAYGAFGNFRSLCRGLLVSRVPEALEAVSAGGFPDLTSALPHESAASMAYRTRLREIGTPVTGHNRLSKGIHESYRSEITLRLIGDGFEGFTGGAELKRMLLSNSPLTREGIRAWSNRYAHGFKPVWPEEIPSLLADSRSPMFSEFEELRRRFPVDPLIADNGWMPPPFYFYLLSKRYFVVGNDHDIAMHLPLFANARKADLASKLAKKYVDSFRKNAADRDRKSLIALWEATQEHQIFEDGKGGIAFIGGAYSLNTDLFIGKHASGYRSTLTAVPQLLEALNDSILRLRLDRDERWKEFLRSMGTRSSRTEDFITRLERERKYFDQKTEGIPLPPRSLEEFDEVLARYKEVFLETADEVWLFYRLNDQPTLDRAADLILDVF